jgi:hypothetical protein
VIRCMVLVAHTPTPPFMGPCTRQVAELLVLAAGLAAASTARNEINASTTQRTPLELTPALFNATGATVRANSSWGVATTHAPEPENERSVTFWGRFVAEPCAGEVWGFTAHHPAPGIAGGGCLSRLRRRVWPEL